MKLLLNAVTIAALLIVSAHSTLFAQAQPSAQRGSGGQRQGRGAGRGEGPPVTPGVSPGDVQRMFDAYALVQAQEQLKIGDEQFAKFMPRFKALQEARRKTQADRGQIIIELRRLSVATPLDEAQIKEKLRALQDTDMRAAADLKKSYESIDQVLDLKQQAQFRVFEEVMERRKLDMIARARANRPRPKPQ
jgi:Spy/CpxP family protein refolding chaperone